jgi:hypothetical protein
MKTISPLAIKSIVLSASIVALVVSVSAIAIISSCYLGLGNNVMLVFIAVIAPFFILRLLAWLTDKPHTSYSRYLFLLVGGLFMVSNGLCSSALMEGAVSLFGGNLCAVILTPLQGLHLFGLAIILLVNMAFVLISYGLSSSTIADAQLYSTPSTTPKP